MVAALTPILLFYKWVQSVLLEPNLLGIWFKSPEMFLHFCAHHYELPKLSLKHYQQRMTTLCETNPHVFKKSVFDKMSNKYITWYLIIRKREYSDK